MKGYGKILQSVPPVNEQARPDQVLNNTGGYVFQLDDWKRLERFLILGSGGGSYYVKERKLTADNAEVVTRCLKADGIKTVQMIRELSVSGRAPKQDPAIFAMAMAMSFPNDTVKSAARAAFSSVIRTGTHLFQFTEEVQTMRGWGRGLKKTVGGWYENKAGDDLAYQMCKYRNRNGWTHRDVLRMAHPKPRSKEQQSLFAWACKGVLPDDAPQLVQDLEMMGAMNAKEIVKVIERNKSITWEMIPSEHLGNPDIWAALLPNMPLTALTRNLARMTANGLLKPLSEHTKLVCSKLTNAEAIKKSRIHPLQALSALYTYNQGRGIKGNLTWSPVQNISSAAESLFYASFTNVEPSNKGFLLALDVSGSMSWGESNVCFPGFTPAMGTAVMAMVLARREPNHHIVGFSTRIIDMQINANDRLEDAMRKVKSHTYGATDCSAAYRFANTNKLDVDCFVIMTDNETNSGGHPYAELVKFRQDRSRPNTKSVVVGMTSTGFSVADPKDLNQLDIVGFDTETPALISNFAKD